MKRETLYTLYSIAERLPFFNRKKPEPESDDDEFDGLDDANIFDEEDEDDED